MGYKQPARFHCALAVIVLLGLGLATHIEAEEQTASMTLTGTLEPFETTLLFPRVNGYLEEILVDIGDSVTKGAAIARVYVPEMLPEMRAAEADVNAAKAEAEKARSDARLAEVTYKRASDLQKAEPGAITSQDVDVAEAQQRVASSEVDVLEAKAKSAQAKVDQLKAMLEYTALTAPYDGIITQRFLDTGALVNSGTTSGKPVVEIVRVERLRLAVFLPEEIVPKVNIGDAVSVTVDALGGKAIEARLDRFSGSLALDTRSMRAEIHLDNADGSLRPGMYARVTLAIPKSEPEAK